MTDTRHVTGRRYSGMDAAQRVGERRGRLLEAGLELFGTAGYTGTSIKQVCRAAALSERYFYESFRSREDLLTKVYNQIIDEAQTDVLAAVGEAGDTLAAQARAGLGTFVAAMTGDGRKAHVVLVEVVGVSPALEIRRRAVMHEFAQLIEAIAAAQLPLEARDPDRLAITAITLVGGVNELLVDWTLGHHHATVDDLVDVTVGLFLGAYQVIEQWPSPVTGAAHATA